MLYLHQKKSERSYFGGRISVAREIVTGHAHAVRYVPLPEAKGVEWKGENHSMAWTGGLVDE